jgi:hypothetical protein
MLLLLMFVLAIILSFAVCVYVLLREQSSPPKQREAQQPSLRDETLADETSEIFR